MPKTVYLDTNVFFDAFEARDPNLFPRLEWLTKSGEVKLVASELNLIEMLAGNDSPQFSVSVERLFSTAPTWLYLTGLPAREVVFAYDRPHRVRSLLPLVKFYGWPELLPLMTSDLARASLPDLATPTAAALLAAYPAEVIKERFEYWASELRSLRTAVREEMQYVGTVQNFFRKTVASTLQVNLADSRELADRLWSDPDLAPAFRLEIELSVHALNVPAPKWSRSDFYDHAHAGALGYVDYFVTRDGLGKKRGLIQKVEWYDREVRLPRARPPYTSKLCRGWLDLERKLKE